MYLRTATLAPPRDLERQVRDLLRSLRRPGWGTTGKLTRAHTIRQASSIRTAQTRHKSSCTYIRPDMLTRMDLTCFHGQAHQEWQVRHTKGDHD